MLVVAHISDLHFNGTAEKRDRIQAVLDYVNARAAGIDALLVTGDITDTGAASEYVEAGATLRSPLPTLICPGNHDSRDEFNQTFPADGRSRHSPGAAAPLNYATTIADTLFLVCDSSIPGENGGYLTDETLAWMDGQISAAGPLVPVLVAFHHPPVDLQMPMMDSIRQTGEDRLAALVQRHPNITMFMCGHAHTGAVTTFAGRPLCLAPGVSSTLNLPFEGTGVVNESQPAGLAFHTYADGRVISHFRTV